MQVTFECEIKGVNTKAVRKNKSECIITIVTESYTPGDDFREMLNKSGRIMRVTFSDSPDEDAVDGMNPPGRDAY